MINNDSVVTAYDEHLTLVEWLQKVEVLLKNGGLKETILNDKGNATFSLTLVFNDGTKLESNAMTLESVNTALASVNTALTSVNTRLTNLSNDYYNASHRIDDLEYAVDYHGFDMTQPFDKDNSVRIGTEFNTNEWTLKRSDNEIELSDEDANKAKEILLKAIRYGFIAYVNSPNNLYGTLISALANNTSVSASFALDLGSSISLTFLAIYVILEDGKWKYICKNLS